MTQEQHTDTVDTTDEHSSAGDSGLVKALRKQIKDKDTELKSRPDRDELWAEFEAQQGRNSAIETQLVALGHPAGIAGMVNEKLGDADVTLEGVAEVLTGIGYEVDVDNAGSEQEDESEETGSGIAGVADLSAKVQSAAGSGGPSTDLDKIASAESPADLAKIASEGGFLQQTS